jgi:ABC-type dipeptide/oligopeptide/nickel transport system permease component
MLLQAITRRDLFLVQGGTIVIVTFILMISLVVDIVYHLVDPRLRAQ